MLPQVASVRKDTGRHTAPRGEGPKGQDDQSLWTKKIEGAQGLFMKFMSHSHHLQEPWVILTVEEKKWTFS